MVFLSCFSSHLWAVNLYSRQQGPGIKLTTTEAHAHTHTPAASRRSAPCFLFSLFLWLRSHTATAPVCKWLIDIIQWAEVSITCVQGETLAFYLRAECRAWGSIPLDYSWFSTQRPGLCVMTWLSCLNHLRNRTFCLSVWMKFKSRIWIFGSKICLFFRCPSCSFMELNYSPCTVWLHNLITCSGVQNVPFKQCQWKFLGKCDILVHLKV